MFRITCPACNSQKIEWINDYERNARIIRCCNCGEMYFVLNEDVFRLPADVIAKEWRDNYHAQKRLTP